VLLQGGNVGKGPMEPDRVEAFYDQRHRQTAFQARQVCVSLEAAGMPHFPQQRGTTVTVYTSL
jgi:hypothetical protein